MAHVRLAIQQLSIDFDVTERKHRGNPASAEAHARARGGKREVWGEIVAMLLQRGPMTGKEIAAALGRELHCVSGRFSELLNARPPLIERTGERRDGSAVLRIKGQTLSDTTGGAGGR